MGGRGVHGWTCGDGMEEDEGWSRSGERHWEGGRMGWSCATGKQVSGRRAHGHRFENMPGGGGRIEGRRMCREEPPREGAAVEATGEGGHTMNAIGVGLHDGCRQIVHRNRRGSSLREI